MLSVVVVVVLVVLVPLSFFAVVGDDDAVVEKVVASHDVHGFDSMILVVLESGTHMVASNMVTKAVVAKASTANCAIGVYDDDDMPGPQPSSRATHFSILSCATPGGGTSEQQ